MTNSMSFGRPYILKVDGCIHDGWLVISQSAEIFDQDYLYWLLSSNFAYMQFCGKVSGAVVKNLNSDKIANSVFPLPPLAEQKRIVAKIEELLPYIDHYEKAWSRLEDLNKCFPVDMQKSILQTAVQGKLVEQRTEEGTAEELYRQIQTEKQRLIKEGKIKKDKPLPEITEDEIPFDIPQNWKWVRLGDCSSYSQRKEKIISSDITPEMWSLDLEDIEKETGRIIRKCKASERIITSDKVCFHKGQVLYSKLRPYLKKVLVAPDDGVCTPEIVPFLSYGDIDSQYIVYVLTSPYVDYVINSATYGVKMPRVGTETMTNLLFPLPPLAEQKRIVAKLQEILPLCEKLK
ncbi:MAG: restriction endonuclease subunit S [Acutalibacteraceae bacterium]